MLHITSAISGDISYSDVRHTLQAGGVCKIDLGSEEISINPTGKGFNIRIGDTSEYCATIREVENFVDSRTFLYEVGCGFMSDGIGEIFDTIRGKYADMDLRYDPKQ